MYVVHHGSGASTLPWFTVIAEKVANDLIVFPAVKEVVARTSIPKLGSRRKWSGTMFLRTVLLFAMTLPLGVSSNTYRAIRIENGMAPPMLDRVSFLHQVAFLIFRRR